MAPGLIATFLLVAALALLLGHLHSFSRTVRYALAARASGVLLEPPDLAERLLKARVLEVTEEQRRQLERDGVIKLEGALPAELAESLDPLIWDHSQENNILPPPWYYNGAVRALMRDGPLAKLAAAALGSRSIISSDMQVWAKTGYGRTDPTKDSRTEMINKYHIDERWAFLRPGMAEQGHLMLTAWLAITEAPSAIVFVKGTHNITGHVYGMCADPGKDGLGIKRGWLDKTCVEGPLAANLTRELGYNALWKPSASPGDLYLFYSHLVHAGIELRARRTAICIRFRGGFFATEHKPNLSPDLPFKNDRVVQLHPDSREIDSLPWLMLPELGQSSPIARGASEAASSFAYWSGLYWRYLRGQANFIKREPKLSIPHFKDL